MSPVPPILPCLLFPPRSWWGAAAAAGDVVLVHTGTPMRNLSYRNRYRIATANGPLLLSVPVLGGRRHDAPLSELMTDDRQGWQRRHWRTLFSAYGRAPFFEALGPELEALIMERGISMARRNLSAIAWMARCMRLPIRFEEITTLPEAARDHYEALAFGEEPPLPPYHQVFEERLGFIPGLSALDLIMMQGPRAGALLRPE